MHEFSLMENALRIVKDVARENGLKTVNSISFVVGRISGINIEALRFAFEALKQQDPLLEKSELAVEEKDGQGKCPRCKHLVPVWHYDLVCPDCGYLPMQVMGGDEFYVKSISGER